MLLEDLPSGQDIFYRIRFRDLAHTDVSSEPVVGRFRTAPGDRREGCAPRGENHDGTRKGSSSTR